MISLHIQKAVLLLSLSTVILFCSSTSALADTHPTDSILRAYEQSTDYVKQVDLALALSEVYQLRAEEKSWLYARKAIAISNKKNYQIGVAKSYNRISELFIKGFHYDSSLSILKKAKDIFIEQSDSLALAKTLYLIGKSHRLLKNYDKSLESHRSSLSIFERLGDFKNVTKVLDDIGIVYRKIEKADSSLFYLHKSLTTNKIHNGDAAIANTLRLISFAHGQMKDYGCAREYLDESFELIEPLGDTVQLIEAYSLLGIIDLNQGDLIPSFENFTNSLNLAKSVNDYHNEANCYHNIAIIQSKLEDEKGAEINFRKGLAIRLKTDSNKVAGSYFALGQVKNNITDTDSALYFLSIAEKIFREDNELIGLSVTKQTQGIVYHNLKNYEKAIEAYKESSSISQRKGDKEGEVNAKFYLGMVYKHTGDVKMSIQLISEALNWGIENSSYFLARDAAQQLSTIHSRAEEFEKAFSFSQIYNDYSLRIKEKSKAVGSVIDEYNFKKDQIEQAKNLQLLAELRSELQAKKARRNTIIFIAFIIPVIGIAIFKIVRLRRKHNQNLAEQKASTNRQNKAIEELSEKLKEASEYKGVLLQEVHHRVKNNLQIIISLLNAQVENSSDHVAITAIQESKNRIRAMALIYKNIYQSEEVSVVKSSSYIQEMVQAIYDSNRKDIDAEISLELDDVDIDLNKAIPVGLIINELATNSFKYAFEESNVDNKLNVRLSYDPNHSDVHLNVSDNGIGMATEIQKTEHTGYGLTLVRGLISQLDGKLNINTKKNMGTSIDILFNMKSA